MASYETAVAREYLLSWLQLLAGDVAFSEGARDGIRCHQLTLDDVIAALESSDGAVVSKEDPHDAFFTIIGSSCDGERLRLVVSLEPLASGLCVHEVEKL